MLSPSIKALLLALMIHATTTNALSLSEFQPKAQNLTPDCQAVYTSTVDGCSNSDFGNGAQCSDACIAGLASIQNQIVSACQADKQNDNNQIIGWMLSPQGISVLCPPATAAPQPSSDASPSDASSSDASPSPTDTPSSSDTPEPTPTPTPTPTTDMRNSTTSTVTLDSTVLMTETSISPLPRPTTAHPSSTGQSTTPTPTSVPSTFKSIATATSTLVNPAEASAQVAAASLCVKGDSSEHGGSLMDTQCSSATRLVGLQGLGGILGFVSVVSTAVLWV